jgi:hypothetical protein
MVVSLSLRSFIYNSRNEEARPLLSQGLSSFIYNSRNEEAENPGPSLCLRCSIYNSHNDEARHVQWSDEVNGLE